MSAFIVDKETIDNIVGYAFDRLQKHWIQHYFAATTPDQLGQILWEMNHDAVNQRYNDNERCPKYTFKPRFQRPIVVYKSLQCFLYQCAEGDVPERESFKAAEEIRANLADDLIRLVPGYEAAPWQ